MGRGCMLVLLLVLVAGTTLAPVSGEGAIAGPPAVVAAAAPAIELAPAGQALEMVRVGIIDNATDVTFFWAQERGYLRELGLDMDTTTFNSANFMVAPLGADQLDVGGGAPGPGLYNAINRGVNVRIVTDRARAVAGTRFNCLMVRKSLLDSGAVRTTADLRGRTIAENAPGVITTWALERELQRAGLTLQDVTFTTLAFPDMLTAFANGAIDAAFQVEPFITQGEMRGVAQCWRPTSELEPDFQIAVLLYGPTFAEQRRESARKFMVAYLRSARDYYRAFYGDGQGRAEMIQLISRITRQPDLGLIDRLGPSWLDPNGSVNVENLRVTQRWFLSRGDQTAEVDFDRVVDMSFVDNALAQLGRFTAP